MNYKKRSSLFGISTKFKRKYFPIMLKQIIVPKKNKKLFIYNQNCGNFCAHFVCRFGTLQQ